MFLRNIRHIIEITSQTLEKLSKTNYSMVAATISNEIKFSEVLQITIRVITDAR